VLSNVDHLIARNSRVGGQRGLEPGERLPGMLRRAGSAPQQDQREHREDSQEHQHYQ
jgi:hypothetical protein